MTTELMLKEQWMQVRDRLAAKQLLVSPDASLSLRIPDADAMWFGGVADTEPRKIGKRDPAAFAAGVDLHASVYATRKDVGAIAAGGGVFGRLLADLGGALPGVFDEQVRHLGRMSAAVKNALEIGPALGVGGNTLLVGGEPVCLGMTASRLALNAELFEKCAKAFVLAAATGGRIKPLPWLVRLIANNRLMKDERRAKLRIMEGELPEESRGY